MVTVTLPAVAAPMVKPVRVTVTAVLAAIGWLAVVMTTELPPVIVGVPEDVGSLGATKPAPVTAVKKLGGNVSVMVLPVASAPPAVVVKVHVAAAVVLPATRSNAVIENESLVT